MVANKTPKAKKTIKVSKQNSKKPVVSLNRLRANPRRGGRGR
jgi:hypothetical protein